jgi:hypothetical protein
MSAIHQPTRRRLIAGIGLLFAAPAIVKASSLMPVKPWKLYGVSPAADMTMTCEFLRVYRDEVMCSYGEYVVVAHRQTVRFHSPPPKGGHITIVRDLGPRPT